MKPVKQNINFPELEREILNRWQEKGIVRKYLEKNKNSKEKFSFLDGPITANNPMGVHHAWGRTYKDLWQRFWNMRGKAQRFQNGFDEQGLWVEVEVEKELGLKNKKDIENLIPNDKFKSLEKFINLCKERVKKFSAVQTEQSKEITHESVYFRLPVSGRKDEYLLVWTTTPWTIPGNVALAINPELKYIRVEFEGNNIILQNPTVRVWGV